MRRPFKGTLSAGIVVILIGCSSSNASLSTTTGLTNSPQVGIQLASIREKVESLAGSNQDWARNTDRASAERQLQIQACMKEAGFEYLPAPASPVYFAEAVKQPFQWWGSVDAKVLAQHGFGLLEEAILAEKALPSAVPSNPFYESLSPEGKSEFDGKASECADSVIAATSGSSDPNSVGYDLIHELEDRIDKSMASSPADLKYKYKECMSSAGFSAPNPQGIFEAVLQSEFDKLGAYQGSVSSPGFGKALKFEKQVAIADANCRSSLGQDLVDLLQTEVQAWEESHAAEAPALVERWQS